MYTSDVVLGGTQQEAARHEYSRLRTAWLINLVIFMVVQLVSIVPLIFGFWGLFFIGQMICIVFVVISIVLRVRMRQLLLTQLFTPAQPTIYITTAAPYAHQPGAAPGYMPTAPAYASYVPNPVPPPVTVDYPAAPHSVVYDVQPNIDLTKQI
jgi:hypothetical protein